MGMSKQVELSSPTLKRASQKLKMKTARRQPDSTGTAICVRAILKGFENLRFLLHQRDITDDHPV
jgi:hypothetical protein